MSLTTAKICALLLGGAAVGSVSTTVALKPSPKPVAAILAKAKGKPGVPIASRPRVARPEHALRPASPTILDCPLPAIGSPWAAVPSPSPALPPIGAAPPAGLPGGGGVGFAPPGPTPHPIPPSIPEPAAWAMLVVGFGLIGAAARIRPQTGGAK